MWRNSLTHLLLCAALSAYAQTGPADTILVNGRVITGDARDSVVEALAIKNGKVLATGTRAAIEKLAGPSTQRIDLLGRTATPGLIDTHIHFQAVDDLYAVDLSQADSIDACLAKIKAGVAKAQPGEWVRGRGWDEGKFREHRYLEAADIDKVAPNNPVWMMQTTGHYGVANSAALRLAKIDRDTKNPPAGTVERDAAGKPTGILKERNAYGLVTRLIPPYTRAQMRAGLLKAIADANREGMTGVKVPGIGQQDWDLYQELLKDGQLSLHLFALWTGGATIESTKAALDRILQLPHIPAVPADDRLLLGGVKLFMDGSGGARTAWMYDDWSMNYRDTDTGNKGFPTTPPPVYREQVRLIHNAGVHVSTHAIGDQAIDWVVDTYAAVTRDKPLKGLRHGIIHFNIPSDHAIDTLAALQKEYDAGYPELQAPFLWWIGDNYAGNFGQKRNSRVLPLKTLVARGVQFAGGSDSFVTPYPARYGLWASVARETLTGRYGAKPFGTAESIDIHTALTSYTRWAAHQLFLDGQIGSLEPGKDADVAIWDRDFYRIPTAEIKDARCEMTLFRGNKVWDRKEASVR